MTYKVLKFRFLLNPTFFLTLILSCGLRAQAQFGPLRFKTKFQQPDSLFSYSLQTGQVPDSTRRSLMKIGCEFQSSYPTVFWALSNSGAILAFQDSLLENPLVLEKRNVYPFIHIRSWSKYRLEITKSNGKDGYLAVRLLNETGNLVLDEVFLCLLQTDLRVRMLNFVSESWIFKKI